MPRRFHRIQLAALERDLLSVAGVCDVFPLERIRNCYSLASLASCLRGCLNPLKKFGMPNFLFSEICQIKSCRQWAVRENDFARVVV